MAGIGDTYRNVSLSNCFVIGQHTDSYGGIFLNDQHAAQLMKRRGGVGHDLSYIRPKGSKVNNAARTSTGIESFMHRFSNTTNEVAQDGRRGALMLSVNISHPDAEDFIDAKLDTTKVTGANISVKIDDVFMNAVKMNAQYLQSFTLKDGNKVNKLIKAKELWNKIVNNSWKSAEPGVLFWDTVTSESPADQYEGYESVSTNPCGEIPLCPYDSCRLININIFTCVKNPFTDEAEMDWDLLEMKAAIAQRMMDNIIDLEAEKIQKIIDIIEDSDEPEHVKAVELDLWRNIIDKTVNGRRTGVGHTGIGDALAALGVTYGSEHGISLAEEIQSTIAVSCYKQSIQLAKERGHFKGWSVENDKGSRFIQRILECLTPEEYRDYLRYGRRNIACLTIAPTGTVSLMTQTTSGIEPVFLITYKRRKKYVEGEPGARVDFIDKLGVKWQEYSVFHHNFITWFMVTRGISRWEFAKENLEALSDSGIEDLIKKSPYYKATSADVDYIGKVEMQGKMQKWVDHSISVTVNMPKDVTVDTVGEVMMRAWEVGCKGVTIYRDGSRSGVLVSNEDKTDYAAFKDMEAFRRPEKLQADIHHVKIDGSPYTAIVGVVEDRPYEIYILNANISFEKKMFVRYKDKNYSLVDDECNIYIEDLSEFIDKNSEYAARMTSMALRARQRPRFIVEQTEKCELPMTSEQAVISRILKMYFREDDKAKCSECGGEIVFEDGCQKCLDCGNSKCG
jgi:ribonucleoside-diphosphate reductase alpha chain